MARLRGVYLALLTIAGALTLVVAARTFWYLFHSITNVPYSDQWAMLEEIWHRRTGQTGWSYVWSPYWGQRMLLPRLLFLLSVKYLHYAMLPFILINVAAVAIVHLLLSSLQMEGVHRRHRGAIYLRLCFGRGGDLRNRDGPCWRWKPGSPGGGGTRACW